MPPAWQMVVPTIIGGGVGARAAKVIVTANTINWKESGATGPLMPNQPTMMEEWRFTGIWLPMQVVVAPEKEETGITAQLTVNLVYGGDIIWSTGRELTGFGIGKAGKAPVISESLNQAIPITRGRTLQLEASLEANTPTTQLAVIFNVITNAGTSQQGLLSYFSSKLSGHKEL